MFIYRMRCVNVYIYSRVWVSTIYMYPTFNIAVPFVHMMAYSDLLFIIYIGIGEILAYVINILGEMIIESACSVIGATRSHQVNKFTINGKYSKYCLLLNLITNFPMHEKVKINFKCRKLVSQLLGFLSQSITHYVILYMDGSLQHSSLFELALLSKLEITK